MKALFALRVGLFCGVLACEPLPNPTIGLAVNPSATATGDGSECSPFQSLSEGLAAAAQFSIATVRIGSGVAEVTTRTAVSNQLAVTGAPSTLLVTALLTVESGGKLLLRLLHIAQSNVGCMGGLLSLIDVEVTAGTIIQIAGGEIDIKNSTFTGLAAPIIEVLHFRTLVNVEGVAIKSCGALMHISSDIEEVVELIVANASFSQSGRVVHCEKSGVGRLVLRMNNGVIEQNTKELFADYLRNAVVEVRNVTVANSLQMMTGNVINSTFVFTNCTFRQGKSRLIDLSSFLGEIAIHNSTVTDIAQGPLILIPANQYHYSTARISISSCRISKVTNLNTRVTGGIANAASIALTIQESEIWGLNVSADGLFTLTNGVAEIDDLYLHDSSAVTFSLYEAKMSVVSFTNIVATRLTHTTSRYTGCVLTALCNWANVSITDSINPNPLAAASFTLLWSAFGGNSTVRNSYFRNPGRSNPCMGPSDSGQLYIFNTTFSDLTNNGVFVVLSDGQLFVNNITLIRPNAVILFTCYWAANCIDARNVKVEGKSSISAVMGGNGDYSISDSVFTGVYYSHFVARGGTLTVKNVTAISSTGYLCRACEKTNIRIDSLTVINLNSPYIFEAFNCTVTLSNFVFTNVTATQLFSLEVTTVEMKQGTFSFISVDSFGGFLAASNAQISLSSVVISDVISALSMKIGLLQLYSSRLEITQSTFTRFNSTLVYAFETPIHIRDSVFIEGGMYPFNKPKAVFSYGSVLWSEHSPSVTIEDCVFHKLASDFGGVLYLSGSDNGSCHISNISASMNSAKQKGGFAYIDKVMTTIVHSTILSHSANYGGALWTMGSSGELLLSIFDSQLINNTAFQEGGAVQTIESRLYHHNTKWESNSAVYGMDFASKVSKLGVVHNVTHALVDHFTIDVASGQMLEEEIVIACLDELDQVVTTLNFVRLALTTENCTINLPNLLEAKNGLFTIPSVTVIGEPLTAVKISAVLGEALRTEVITARIRECVAGEYYVGSRCELCTHNTYSLKPSQPCTLCPVIADCPVGFRLHLHSGYWRTDNMTDVIYRCLVPELCTGGFNSECMQGHSGVMCAHCEDRYFKVNQLQCIQCGSPAVSAFKAALTLLASAASVAVSQFVDENLQMLHAVVFDYLQSIRILENLNLYWPKSLAYLFSVVGDVGSVGLTAFTDSCFGAVTGIQLFYSQLIVAALYCTLLLLVTAFACCAIKTRYTAIEPGRMVSVLFYFAYLLLPLLFLRMIEAFSCFHIGGKYYLTYDTSVECWTHLHLSYSLGIALPLLLVSLVLSLALFAVSIVPKVSYRLPHLSTLAIMLNRKLAMNALLVFSNAWALCTQASLAICLNILSEILMYRLAQNQSQFAFTLYQSTLVASTLQSFACVIYSASVSSMEDKEGPFISISYLCTLLPLVHIVLFALSRTRRLRKVMQASEAPMKSLENALQFRLDGSLEVSEVPLQVPNPSFASVKVSPSEEPES